MRVFYPNPIREDVADELRALVGPECEVSTGEKPEDYELLIEGRIDEDLISAPSLKAVVIPFAGVPVQTLELLRKYPHVTGHNLHHNASDTAEVALALLFAAAKLVVPMDQRMRKNDWGSRYEDSRAVSLEGKTAVVLGYGQIGQRIARVLLACGMKIIAVRRRADGAETGVEIVSSSRMHEVLPRANVLMIALPQTPETTALLGEKELASLPQDAILVNIARGPIVDEEALYNALESGHLHSAGLDVWYQYPQAAANTVPGYFNAPEMAHNTPPSKFPFGELDNVVMSPHRGGTSIDTEARRVRDLAAIVRAAASGERIPNQVDIVTGY